MESYFYVLSLAPRLCSFSLSVVVLRSLLAAGFISPHTLVVLVTLCVGKLVAFYQFCPISNEELS